VVHGKSGEEFRKKQSLSRQGPITFIILLLAFSVVLHLMLLLLSLPATLYTNHSKHVETSYIVLRLTFSVATLVDI
jgi:hypothetical protein